MTQLRRAIYRHAQCWRALDRARLVACADWTRTRATCHNTSVPANYFSVRTLATTIIGLLALGLLVFVPAGTLAYWQGWLFIVVFAASTQAIGIYLAFKDPALLARRMQAGPGAEQRPFQRIVISLAFLSLPAAIVFCALDHRFGWSTVPAWVSILGAVLVALGLFIDLLVMRENTFSASNVRVEQGQTVISTGPYAIARHPMYGGVLIMVVGVPLALGSWLGLWVLVLAIPVLVLRILDEEKLLRDELLGYPEYAQHVRYRLVPFVW